MSCPTFRKSLFLFISVPMGPSYGGEGLADRDNSLSWKYKYSTYEKYPVFFFIGFGGAHCPPSPSRNVHRGFEIQVPSVPPLGLFVSEIATSTEYLPILSRYYRSLGGPERKPSSSGLFGPWTAARKVLIITTNYLSNHFRGPSLREQWRLRASPNISRSIEAIMASGY